MRKFTLALILISASAAWGQASQMTVYLDPANSFSSTFAAAVQKKHLPVTITTDPDQAEFVVNFSSDAGGGSKGKGITSAIFYGQYQDGSFQRISIAVVDAKTKAVVFSDSCQRMPGYEGKIAECLAGDWGKRLKGK